MLRRSYPRVKRSLCIISVKSLGIGLTDKDRFAGAKGLAARCAFHWDGSASGEGRELIRVFEHVCTQFSSLGVVESYSAYIVRHDSPEAAGDYVHELVEIEMRDDSVVDIEQQLKTVTLASQLLTGRDPFGA